MAGLRIRTIAALAIGFGFGRVEHAMDVRGDLDRLAWRPADALAHHSLALFFNLLALACFLYAVVSIVRGWRAGRVPPPPRGMRPTPEPTFDPDAVMARYLATRDAPPSQHVPTTGFGRKRG